MRIFVTGVSGLLGLNFALQARGRAEIAGTFHRHPVAIDGVRALDLDVLSRRALDAALTSFRPDAVVHTVGLTSVDACEREPALAVRLNVEAAGVAAAAAQAHGAMFVHISTDQLFDGSRPFTAENAPPAPLNVYGASKRDAEAAVLEQAPGAAVIRTNFYGWGTSVRTSFSDWILASLERRETLHMFSDAYFTPILINDLCDLLLEAIERRAAGVLNVAGGERLSKYAFAHRLAAEFGLAGADIVARPLDSFGLQARRPHDMSLDTSRAAALFGRPMPDASAGLARLRRLREAGWPQQLESAIGRASRV